MTVVDLERAFYNEPIAISQSCTCSKVKVTQTSQHRFTLAVATSKTPDLIKIFKKTVIDWSVEAKKYEDPSTHTHKLSHTEKQLVRDSLMTLKLLQEEIPNSLNSIHHFYLVYDDTRTIQALGYGVMNEKEASLNSICTNPKNLPIPGNRNQVRGAATALIKHMAEEMVKIGTKEISLYPLTSALHFYKKIGFEEATDKMGLISTANKILQHITK